MARSSKAPSEGRPGGPGGMWRLLPGNVPLQSGLLSEPISLYHIWATGKKKKEEGGGVVEDLIYCPVPLGLDE